MAMSSVTTRDGDILVTADNAVEKGALAAPLMPPTPPLPTIAGGHLSATDNLTIGVHSDKPLDGASFIAGLMLGALLYFIIQSAMRWHARREVRSIARAVAIGPQIDDGMAAAVAALSRRTATLETIVTDPAQRTARAIDALR